MCVVNTEQDKGRIVALSQDELDARAKFLPKDAVLIGGLTHEHRKKEAEAPMSKCATMYYAKSDHTLHEVELCTDDGGVTATIVSDVAIASI